VSAPDAAGLSSRPVSHVVWWLCGFFSGSCRKQDKDYVLLLVTVFIVVWNAFCLPQQQPSLLGGDCHLEVYVKTIPQALFGHQSSSITVLLSVHQSNHRVALLHVR
jgi:hypothetical protein